MSRWSLRVILTTAVAITLAAILSPPAFAGTLGGTWRGYGNTNPITSSQSSWYCASTKTVDQNVGAQVCLVRSSSRTGIQGAVIVRNNNSSPVHSVAGGHLYNAATLGDLGGWDCAYAAVAANAWTVCFSRTIAWSDTAYAEGYYIFTNLGRTGSH